MSELMVIGCGGTGINIMKDVIDAPGTRILKEAKYLAFDSSDSNSSDGKFEVLHMNSAKNPGQKAQGSGKDVTLNFENHAPFIAESFKVHKPGKFCIVIMSAAGGTGSGQGFAVLRYLLSRGIPTVGLFVLDHTSLVERRNSTKIMVSISNQVQERFLGKVIPHIRIVNDDRTRREINDEAILNLNYVSLFLTESNEELDFEDIANALQYSKVTGLPPALSEINFLTDDAVTSYNGKPPVSFCSIFDHRDNARPLFKDSAYRATGVINPDNNPPNAKTIVMMLDHGEAVEKLEVEMEELEATQQKAKSSFIKQKDLSSNADESGFDF
jgi:hypothetical protein